MTAAHLLARPYGRVVINYGSGGMSEIDPIPDEGDLEDCLDELCILLIASVVDTRSVLVDDPHDRRLDENVAQSTAAVYTATPDEAAQLVELGRAKARTMASDPMFIQAVERLADPLLEAGELSGDEVRAILESEGRTNGAAT